MYFKQPHRASENLVSMKAVLHSTRFILHAYSTNIKKPQIQCPIRAFCNPADMTAVAYQNVSKTKPSGVPLFFVYFCVFWSYFRVNSEGKSYRKALIHYLRDPRRCSGAKWRSPARLACLVETGYFSHL